MALFIGQTLLKRRIAQADSVPPSITNLISYAVGVMPLSLIVGLLLPHHVEWSLWTVLLLILEGGFISVFMWLSMRAMKLLPTAYFQTVFQVSTIVIILLGWLLLNETLTPLQGIGAVLIFTSALLAIWAPVRAHRKGNGTVEHFRAGVILSAASAVAIGIGLVAEKAALAYMDLGAYFIVGFGAQTIGLLVLAAPHFKKHPLHKLSRKVIKDSVILGFTTNFIGYTYLYSLQASNNISLITALKAFGLPLTAIAAHYILRERDDNKLLWAAMALGVVGIVITAL